MRALIGRLLPNRNLIYLFHNQSLVLLCVSLNAAIFCLWGGSDPGAGGRSGSAFDHSVYVSLLTSSDIASLTGLHRCAPRMLALADTRFVSFYSGWCRHLKFLHIRTSALHTATPVTLKLVLRHNATVLLGSFRCSVSTVPRLKFAVKYDVSRSLLSYHSCKLRTFTEQPVHVFTT